LAAEGAVQRDVVRAAAVPFLGTERNQDDQEERKEGNEKIDKTSSFVVLAFLFTLVVGWIAFVDWPLCCCTTPICAPLQGCDLAAV
jgi:hypothetical protein